MRGNAETDSWAGLSFVNSKIENFVSSFRPALIFRRRIAAIVFLVAILISILSWQTYIRSQRKNIKNIIRMELKLVEAKFNRFLETRKHKLSLLADKLSRDKDYNLDSFDRMNFDFIALVNKKYQIEKVNRDILDLLGKQIALLESERLYLNAFKDNQKIAISSNLNIYGKGKELNFFVPITSENLQEQGTVLLASIKLENLFSYLFSSFYDHLNIKVYATDSEIFSNSDHILESNFGSFHWGLDYDSIYDQVYIALSGQETIRVLALPSEKLVRSLAIFPDFYVLLIAIFFSLLLAFVFYYLSSYQILFSRLKTLIKSLEQQIIENHNLKDSLEFVTKSAVEDINSKSEALKIHKANAYKLVQEVLKSKQTEENKSKAIQKDSNRLKLALESVGIGTWAWDIKEDKIIWDNFTKRIFCINETKTQSSYERFLKRISTKDLDKVVSRIEKALYEGGNLNISFRINCPGNYEKELTLKAKVFMGIDSEPMHMAGIILDNNYDVNNSMLLNKFFSLPIVMFCVADLKGNFKILNSAWSDVLGYSIEELKSRPFLYFVHPMDEDKTQIEYQLLMGEEGYKTTNFSNRYRCKNGSYKTLVWNAIKMKYDNLIYAIAWDMSGTLLEEDFVGLEDQRAAF